MPSLTLPVPLIRGNTLINLFKKQLTAALLCSIALAAPFSNVVGKEGPQSAALNSFELLYQERIARINLEILNETKRRTTILSQLDSVINEISSVDKQKTSNLETSPQLAGNLKELEGHLKSTKQKIELNNHMLQELTKASAEKPRPTMWQAALGRSDLKQIQTRAAAHRYLVHTTQKHKQQLAEQHQLLTRRLQSLLEYNSSISDSLGELDGLNNSLLDKRRNLEQQLAVLSGEIVERQDRITDLERRFQKLRSNPAQMQFARLRKKLPDPVAGTLFKKFAEPKAKGLLRWDGILVAAPLGEPFNAVSDGVVIFADELQGLGNVAIVDHGDNYLSLYGTAELLFVQKDQLLLAGDPIGTVGKSAGTDTSALYFEIRSDADPLDPQDWLEMKQIQ